VDGPEEEEDHECVTEFAEVVFETGGPFNIARSRGRRSWRWNGTCAGSHFYGGEEEGIDSSSGGEIVIYPAEK